MLETVKRQIDSLRAARVLRQSRHRTALKDVPPGLYDYWRRSAHLEFTGIPRDRVFFVTALAGLLDFFACVRDSGKPCGLPSAAADSVWHAWAQRAPQGLARFCTTHFRQAIPHVEEVDMKLQMVGALATCMVQARRLERRDPLKPSVPALFALDRKLRMPRGYSYELKNGAVALQRLNAQGLPDGWRRYQGGLAGVELLAAGLISQQVYDRQEKHQASVGGSCGSISSCGSSDSGAGSCDSGAGSCDGGSGSSCGSSCGSGCGGGCGS